MKLTSVPFILLLSILAAVVVADRKKSPSKDIEVECIDDPKGYCAKKAHGFKFQDGCRWCTCMGRETHCKKGPCEFFPSHKEDPMEYCDKLLRNNEQHHKSFVKNAATLKKAAHMPPPPQPKKGKGFDEKKQDDRAEDLIEVHCIENHKAYCKGKPKNFKFQDGCRWCICDSGKNGAECKKGACEFYLDKSTNVKQYCENVFKGNSKQLGLLHKGMSKLHEIKTKMASHWQPLHLDQKKANNHNNNKDMKKHQKEKPPPPPPPPPMAAPVAGKHEKKAPHGDKVPDFWKDEEFLPIDKWFEMKHRKNVGAGKEKEKAEWRKDKKMAPTYVEVMKMPKGGGEKVFMAEAGHHNGKPDISAKGLTISRPKVDDTFMVEHIKHALPKGSQHKKAAPAHLKEEERGKEKAKEEKKKKQAVPSGMKQAMNEIAQKHDKKPLPKHMLIAQGEASAKQHAGGPAKMLKKVDNMAFGPMHGKEGEMPKMAVKVPYGKGPMAYMTEFGSPQYNDLMSRMQARTEYKNRFLASVIRENHHLRQEVEHLRKDLHRCENFRGKLRGQLQHILGGRFHNSASLTTSSMLVKHVVILSLTALLPALLTFAML